MEKSEFWSKNLTKNQNCWATFKLKVIFLKNMLHYKIRKTGKKTAYIGTWFNLRIVFWIPYIILTNAGNTLSDRPITVLDFNRMENILILREKNQFSKESTSFRRKKSIFKESNQNQTSLLNATFCVEKPYQKHRPSSMFIIRTLLHRMEWFRSGLPNFVVVVRAQKPYQVQVVQMRSLYQKWSIKSMILFRMTRKWKCVR